MTSLHSRLFEAKNKWDHISLDEDCSSCNSEDIHSMYSNLNQFKDTKSKLYFENLKIAYNYTWATSSSFKTMLKQEKISTDTDRFDLVNSNHLANPVNVANSGSYSEIDLMFQLFFFGLLIYLMYYFCKVILIMLPVESRIHEPESQIPRATGRSNLYQLR